MLSDKDQLAADELFYNHFDETIKTLTLTPESGKEILKQSEARDRLRFWADDMRNQGPRLIHIDCARALGIRLAQKAIREGTNKVGRWTALGRMLTAWTHRPLYVQTLPAAAFFSLILGTQETA